jgi:HAD superfamily hydrolase (TIGR01549 family)
MITAIIFDFDGVIVDSVDVKAQAFAALFHDCSADIQRCVIDFHRRFSGMSRYEKIQRLYKQFRDQVLTLQEVEEQVEKFSKICFEKVVRSAYIIGAHEFLSTYSSQYDCYIASGTPEEELRAIVEQRHLTAYFKGVFGTPREKTAICRAILDQKGYRPNQTVMIGDTLVDYKAAVACGMHFIARLDITSRDALASYTLPFTIRDLACLNEFLIDKFTTPFTLADYASCGLLY